MRCWAEVSLGRLRHNFQVVRRRVGPRVAVMAVVKADAYGHGAVPVARALAAEGAVWFGVTCAEEGVELRRAGITQPILLMSGFLPGEETGLAEHRLTPVVYDRAQIAALDALGLPYHLKVNTGMGRLGLERADLEQAALDISRRRKDGIVEGLCTHFASAGEGSAQTDYQVGLFRAALATLGVRGLRARWIHLANSAALATRTDCFGNLVRPGIALYGYLNCEHELDLKQVMSLKTRVVAMRDTPAGTPLGYSAGFVTRQPSRIATLSAGYADGLRRHLSNQGYALVRGRRAPLVGVVSMDLTLVDVTAIPDAAVGDIATLLGEDGRERITAEQVATQCGTIAYEVLCGVGKRVPRVVTD
jgi:alanine racemase